MSGVEWPRGTTEQQLAIIDDRLANIATVLREARGNDEFALLIDLEARLEELLDDRNRVAATLPKPRTDHE